MKIITILLCGLVTATCAFSETAPAKKKLSVGAVLSLTGMASAHAMAIQDGLEFAKVRLAEKGWDIHIAYEDDGTEPRRTISAVQRLTSSGVKFIIGPTWGTLAIPAAPVFKQSGAVSLQPCNSSDFVGVINDRYFFFFTPPSRAQQPIIAFLRPFQGKKVAIINNSSSWGELWRSLFEKAAKEVKAELAFVEMVQFGEIDAATPSLVTKLKQHGIEVLLGTTTKENIALMIANLEKQRVPITMLSPDLIDSVTDKLTTTNSAFVTGYTVTPKNYGTFPEDFKNWKGRLPHKYTDSGYDTLLALTEAIEHAGSEPEKVKKYLEESLDIPGAAGRLKFSPQHDVEGADYEVLKLIDKDA